jgi:serine/threonine protein kinase
VQAVGAMGLCQANTIGSEIWEQDRTTRALARMGEEVKVSLTNLYDIQDWMSPRKRKALNRQTNELSIIEHVPKSCLPAEETSLFLDNLGRAKQLREANIIRLIDVFEDDHFWYLVQENHAELTLLEHLAEAGGFSEEQIMRLIRDICSLLAICHKSGLKVYLLQTSIFYDSEKPTKVHLKPFRTFSGLRKCLFSPVELRDLPPEFASGRYDISGDIWCLGLITYQLLGGLPHLLGWDEAVWQSKIQDPSKCFLFQGRIWWHISELAQKFIVRLTSKNLADRPSAEEALTDEWLLEPGEEIVSKGWRMPIPESSKRLRSLLADMEQAHTLHDVLVEYSFLVKQTSEILKMTRQSHSLAASGESLKKGMIL